MVGFTIDKELCNNCGECAAICPNAIIKIDENDYPNFRVDRISLCISCAHCMAICATKAIIAGTLSYENNLFEFSKKNQAGLMPLFASRRSVRSFENKAIPEELLQNIIDAISFAPPTVGQHCIEITIIQNDEVIDKMLPLLGSFYTDLGKWVDSKFTRVMMRKSLPEEKFNMIINHLHPRIKAGLYNTTAEARDGILRGAPCILIIHADKSSAGHTEDAWIAATHAILAAHSIGLGATIIGLVPPAIEKSLPLRDLLQIPIENEAVAAVLLGFPRYIFKRGINRKIKNINRI